MRFFIDEAITSKANVPANWRMKSVVAAKQRQLAKETAEKAMSVEGKLDTTTGDVMVVWFHRYGSKLLDDDNLAYSIKNYRDGICEALGIDDAPGPNVMFLYTQSTSKKDSVGLMVSVRLMNKNERYRPTKVNEVMAWFDAQMTIDGINSYVRGVLER